MVEPQSKKVQLLSPSILTQDYILRSTPLNKWIGVQEGNFLGYPSDSRSLIQRMLAEWLLVSEGSRPPFFIVPSFVFKLHFSGILAKILQTIFHEMVRTTTSKTISIFPLIQLDHIGKINNIPN